MTKRTVNSVLLGILAVLVGSGPVRAAGPLDDPSVVQFLKLPAAADGAVQPSVPVPSVPVVPLPPAFYGSVAAVGMIVALRRSRHWRWVTLRG